MKKFSLSKKKPKKKPPPATFTKPNGASKSKKAPDFGAPKGGNTRHVLPGLWHKELAGVSLTHAPGPGECLLDEICRLNGWTWGIIATHHKDGNVVTSVLIGKVFNGEAKPIEGGKQMYRPWDEVDEALAQIARQLEDGDGGAG